MFLAVQFGKVLLALGRLHDFIQTGKCIGLILLNGCFKIQVMVTVWRLTQRLSTKTFSASHERNVMDHGISTYMLSSVCYNSSSGTTVLITPATVYLADKSVLPPEVVHDIQEGNFEVKRTDRRFNLVSAGRSTEWLNAIGRKWPSIITSIEQHPHSADGHCRILL